jgi:hypothetical protein
LFPTSKELLPRIEQAAAVGDISDWISQYYLATIHGLWRRFSQDSLGVGWERNLKLASLGGLAGEQPVPASSGIKDVVHLKRLVDLVEPLDPAARRRPRSSSGSLS